MKNKSGKINTITVISFSVLIVSFILIIIGLSMQSNGFFGEKPAPQASNPPDINEEHFLLENSDSRNDLFDKIEKANQYIDNENYPEAEKILNELKNTNSNEEIIYITFSKMYGRQSLYHAAKGILLEGKQKADTIQEINQQLGIIDEKIEKGESLD